MHPLSSPDARVYVHAESNQLSLTGMAWWTVSRAVEFAGGAAYIFLPGFQSGKDGEGKGDGDGKKNGMKVSDGDGAIEGRGVEQETAVGQESDGGDQSSGGDRTSDVKPPEVVEAEPASSDPAVDG